MFWQEDEDPETIFIVPDDVVDLAFSIDCRALPVDHTYALAAEIERHLPWFIDEARCGLHLIHGADSGNGWERPENGEDLLYLSRRTKLVLRIPKERIEAAREGLTGKELTVGDCSVRPGRAECRKLVNSSALYSRYVKSSKSESEALFINRVVAQIGRRLASLS